MHVTDLVQGVVANAPVLAVEVPVLLDDKRRYVLSHAFFPAELEVAFRRDEVPANYIIGIFDRKGISIARSQRAAGTGGEAGSQGTVRRVAQCAPEGVLQHDTRENIQVYHAYKRSALSGWTVAVGVPVVIIEASTRRAVMAASLGLMAAIGCALALAVYFSRRMAQSIDSAASSAVALGRGEMPQRMRRACGNPTPARRAEVPVTPTAGARIARQRGAGTRAAVCERTGGAPAGGKPEPRQG